jgi:hypothetical protein
MNTQRMFVRPAIAVAQDLAERRLPMRSWPLDGQYTEEEQMEDAVLPWDDPWTDIGGEG